METADYMTTAGSKVRYRHTAGLLGIFGGALGMHNFYLGFRNRAIAQLLITLLGSFCFGIGPCVSAIWGLVEGIQILSGDKTVDGDGRPIESPDYAARKSKSKTLAGILGFFLGMFGVHNFYLGYTNKAIAQLLLGTVGSILVIGPIISMVWGMIDAVQILSCTIRVDGSGAEIYDPSNDGTRPRSRTAAAILAMWLGVFGVHSFYLGDTTKGVIQLLCGTIGGCLIVGPIVSAVWGILDGVKILSGEVTADAQGIELMAD